MSVVNLSVYGSGLTYSPYEPVNSTVSLETNKRYEISTPQRENLFPTNPSIKYEIEVEANNSFIVVTTKQTQQTGKATLYRTVFNGSFAFDSNGNLASGTVASVAQQWALNGADINQSQKSSIKQYQLVSPLDWNTLNTNGGLRSNVDYTEVVDTGKFSDTYFPGSQEQDWWQFNPFEPLILGSSASGLGSIQSTKAGADNLTGLLKNKDLFVFGSSPEFGIAADKITNFSTKDKDSLQFSKSAFGLSKGRFAIAKTQKKLDKLLATDVNIVYFKPKGELIFNANGSEAGFGTDGGVFAELVGAPKLTGGSVSFI